MTHEVLVCVDGLRASAHAVPVGVALAEALDASVHLTRVFDLSHDQLSNRAGMLGIGDAADEARAAMQQALDAHAAAVAATGVRATTALLEGDADVAHAIVEHARRRNAGAIVLATRARTGIARALLGSVADRVMRTSPVPVVLVPPGEHPDPHHVPDPRTRRPILHVLVPVDASPHALAIVDRLLTLPLPRGATVTLLQVVAPGGAPDHAPDAARAAIDAVARRLDEAGMRARVEVVAADEPAAAILAATRDLGADLVAMATHGRGGFARFTAGSVTDRVVRGAAVPVMVSAAGDHE